MTTIGSLFSGAGGLDLAVEQVFNGTVQWHSEIQPAANAVLNKHWSGVPNLGDITEINWSHVQPVDVLCGGFPCQDVSSAASSRRAGMKPGNRSGLWSHMAHAIDQLKPNTVIIENVRGLLSAKSHRNLEPHHTTLGETGPADRDAVLRAAGAVLGDLADIGFHAWWATTTADNVGGPHRRERVFIVAQRAGTQTPQIQQIDRPHLDEEHLTLLPTPSASDVTGGSCDPAIRVAQGHHLQLIDVVRMYGTPAWETYMPAIRRWERITRPAPTAAITSSRGNPILSPDFAEWMMGWPDQWTVSGSDGIELKRSDRLRLFGNGVVPQQAAATISGLITILSSGLAHV